ncbi:MAG: metallophosphoesterase [Phycisphaeraceae bacterium]
MTPPLSRRTFLAGSTAAAAALLTGCDPITPPTPPPNTSGTTNPSKPTTPNAGGGFSFLHLTDMHVARRRKGHLGYQTCINEVSNLTAKPAFALMGGDLAFDGLYNAKSEFIDQIRLYKDASDQLPFPYHNCMGNHDILGWDRNRKVQPSDPDYGKKCIMDRLEWEKPFYSFDHQGWHFTILDCIHPITADHGQSWEPRIDDAQLEWLAHDLGRAADKPKVVMTHIALFCNIGQQNADPNARAMSGMVIQNNRDLRHILERHNVTAVLQGHSHRAEVYQFNNIWYITSPAVSGAWWAGDFNGGAPGYTLLTTHGRDLHWDMRYFNWTPHLEPADTLEKQRLEERRQFLQQQAELAAQERTPT